MINILIALIASATIGAVPEPATLEPLQSKDMVGVWEAFVMDGPTYYRMHFDSGGGGYIALTVGPERDLMVFSYEISEIVVDSQQINIVAVSLGKDGSILTLTGKGGIPYAGPAFLEVEEMTEWKGGAKGRSRQLVFMKHSVSDLVQKMSRLNVKAIRAAATKPRATPHKR